MKAKITWMPASLCLGLVLGRGACAQTPEKLAVKVAENATLSHVLEDRVWDARAQQFITEAMLFQRAAQARYVLLGEKHDSDAHHARQLDLLKGLAARGIKPTLAMEQLDTDYQAALSQAQIAGHADAEKLADAGQLNRKGWRWPMYKDLISFAAEQQWPLVAANLSRMQARKIALGEVVPALAAVTHEQQAALENDVVQGHCGHRPEPSRLNGIVNAQRARDALMAQVLDAAGGTVGSPVVLIAGAGHVRSDRAVPRYLAEPNRALTIAMVEVSESKAQPTDYDRAGFDVLWFTRAIVRPDPCAAPLPGLAAPAHTADASTPSNASLKVSP